MVQKADAGANLDGLHDTRAGSGIQVEIYMDICLVSLSRDRGGSWFCHPVVRRRNVRIHLSPLRRGCECETHGGSVTRTQGCTSELVYETEWFELAGAAVHPQTDKVSNQLIH